MNQKAWPARSSIIASWSLGRPTRSSLPLGGGDLLAQGPERPLCHPDSVVVSAKHLVDSERGDHESEIRSHRLRAPRKYVFPRRTHNIKGEAPSCAAPGDSPPTVRYARPRAHARAGSPA